VSSHKAARKATVGECLSAELRQRCKDRSVKWAYHPQSNNVGQIVAQNALARLIGLDGGIASAIRAGRISVEFNASIAGRRRSKKVDLAMGYPVDVTDGEVLRPDEFLCGPISSPLLLCEVKSCMTAHQKARPRLVSELLSTLEVADGLRPRPIVLGFIVMNYARRFTSPKNLPGPNLHNEGDASRALEQLFSQVPTGEGDGYDALVVVPISFDNEAECSVVPANASSYSKLENHALNVVDRRVSRLIQPGRRTR
jgi:hypothetical protein